MAEVKKDCFGFKKGVCTVLSEMVCKDHECCTFYKTKQKFREDARRAAAIVKEKAKRRAEERKMNNVK